MFPASNKHRPYQERPQHAEHVSQRRTARRLKLLAGQLPILDALLTYGDYYRHLADLGSYAQAQRSLGELYTDQQAWTRKAILNIAASGKFSSDRTIAEYAREIWSAKPCPV